MTPYASYVATAIINSLSLAISGFLMGFAGYILLVRFSSNAVKALGCLLVMSGFIVALLGIFLTLSPHAPESSTFFTVRQGISSYSEQL
jgi:hypothetical protein